MYQLNCDVQTDLMSTITWDSFQELVIQIKRQITINDFLIIQNNDPIFIYINWGQFQLSKNSEARPEDLRFCMIDIKDIES